MLRERQQSLARYQSVKTTRLAAEAKLVMERDQGHHSISPSSSNVDVTSQHIGNDSQLAVIPQATLPGLVHQDSFLRAPRASLAASGPEGPATGALEPLARHGSASKWVLAQAMVAGGAARAGLVPTAGSGAAAGIAGLPRASSGSAAATSLVPVVMQRDERELEAKKQRVAAALEQHRNSLVRHQSMQVSELWGRRLQGLQIILRHPVGVPLTSAQQPIFSFVC